MVLLRVLGMLNTFSCYVLVSEHSFNIMLIFFYLALARVPMQS